MKQLIMSSMGMSLAFLLIISNISIAEGGKYKMIENKHGDFFISELPNEYQIFKKYGNFPKQDILEKKLDVKDYKEIVHEFFNWTKVYLNPDCLPTEETLRENICLIKSKYFEDKKEDIAYFGDIIVSVGNEQAEIRIVQAGGLHGSIYFFIKYPNITKKIDRYKANELINSSIGTLLNNPDKIKDLISGISEDGKVFRIEKKHITNWEYQFQTFRGFMFDNVICFRFKKEFLLKDNGTMPATSPSLNEWFDFYRNR